jgi:2'-5' RNA ligase
MGKIWHNGKSFGGFMRLFSALPIPDNAAQSLLGLQHGVPGAHWRPRENLHITLCFYGEVKDPMAIKALDEELASINVRALHIEMGEGGMFGGKTPRALWMGIANNPALMALAEACKGAAQRAGIAVERRSYTPHITLAYCRGTTDAQAAHYLERISGFRAPAFEADHFTLYRSKLGTDPARYIPKAHYALGGEDWP